MYGHRISHRYMSQMYKLALFSFFGRTKLDQIYYFLSLTAIDQLVSPYQRKKTDRHTDRQSDRQTYIHTNIHTYRQTERQTDTNTHRQTHRQTDSPVFSDPNVRNTLTECKTND